jgi:hypothetical protein
LKPPVRFVFFCSGGLEKGKTLVHPTTTPWIVAGFDKIGKSRVPKSSNWARFMLFSFPTSWFLGSASAFFGGPETSDTSFRAPGRAPGGPADGRVVVLPLGTSAQNALGPLSWGARAGDRWGQGWKKGGPKFPRKSYGLNHLNDWGRFQTLLVKDRTIGFQVGAERLLPSLDFHPKGDDAAFLWFMCFGVWTLETDWNSKLGLSPIEPTHEEK